MVCVCWSSVRTLPFSAQSHLTIICKRRDVSSTQGSSRSRGDGSWMMVMMLVTIKVKGVQCGVLAMEQNPSALILPHTIRLVLTSHLQKRGKCKV
jgi:hypothetical protein